jgi:hypothetical protein
VAGAAAAVAGRGRLAVLLALFTGGTALGAAAVPSAFDLAGRYTQSFPNGNVEGEGYTSTDIVTVVPTDRRHAVIEIHTYFFNGHECNIGGRATLEGDALVIRDSEMTDYGDGGICTLRLRRADGRITWDDQGTCTGYCGARGSLRGGGIAWSSRRPMSRATQRRILRDYARTRNRP